jgi:hypothetical protein
MQAGKLQLLKESSFLQTGGGSVVAMPATNDQAETQTVRPNDLPNSGAEVGDLGAHVKDRTETDGDDFVALNTKDNHPQ